MDPILISRSDRKWVSALICIRSNTIKLGLPIPILLSRSLNINTEVHYWNLLHVFKAQNFPTIRLCMSKMFNHLVFSFQKKKIL